LFAAYAGDIDENNTPPELFVLRRAAAYQAYYEAMPLRASALPSGSHMRIYRRLQFGSLIDLSVLDTRQWRSDQPCGDGSRTNCAGRLAPTQTMMGPEQEKWLFDNLASDQSRQPAHQVPQQPPRLHRLHRNARADARRFQDHREGECARPPCAHRRLSRRPGRAAGQQHGLTTSSFLSAASGRVRPCRP
jgi:phosphodiesterase/alkaline phosphatase D-like protein